MINADETRPPQLGGFQNINAAETVAPGGSDTGASLHLMSGESVAGSYIINAMLSGQGKQSDVYLAKKWGKSYVVKVYHDGWHPSPSCRHHPSCAQACPCPTGRP